MIKNIFFDYGRTLVGHPEDGAGDAIIRARGIAGDDVELVKSVVFAVDRFANFVDEGSMSRDEFEKNCLELLPRRLHSQAMGVLRYHSSELPVLPGMEELLAELKSKGYRLYITSNLDPLHAVQVRTLPFAKYFDNMIFSSEIKVRKPFRKFFETALEAFDVIAGETVFIDDLAENVDGAARLGIKGLVFCGNPDEIRGFLYEQNSDF